MSQFKFSIITVVKNDEKNIEKTIKSILNQKLNVEVEYIIVDGNSSDRTLEIINLYKNHINKIISENDEGIYYAMNKAISCSSGNIIGVCNSRDIIYPRGLFHIEKEFRTNNCDFVFGTVIRNYLGNKILKHG